MKFTLACAFQFALQARLVHFRLDSNLRRQNYEMQQRPSHLWFLHSTRWSWCCRGSELVVGWRFGGVAGSILKQLLQDLLVLAVLVSGLQMKRQWKWQPGTPTWHRARKSFNLRQLTLFWLQTVTEGKGIASLWSMVVETSTGQVRNSWVSATRSCTVSAAKKMNIRSQITFLMLLGDLPALFTPSMFVSCANSCKIFATPAGRAFEGLAVFSPKAATDAILRWPTRWHYKTRQSTSGNGSERYVYQNLSIQTNENTSFSFICSLKLFFIGDPLPEQLTQILLIWLRLLSGVASITFGWGVVLASVSIGFLPCRRHSNPIHILPTLSMEFKVFYSGQQLDSTFYLSRRKCLIYGLRRVSHNIQCMIVCIDKRCWLCKINWLGLRYFRSSLFWISLMFSDSNLNLLCMFSGFVPQNEQRISTFDF